MPRRFTDAEAEARLLTFGFRPTSEYPGSTRPWDAECLTCGETVAPRLSQLPKGEHPRCSCRIAQLATIARQRGEAKVAANAAQQVAEMQSYDWQPLEPYPGARTPWRCQCLRCGTVATPRFHGQSKSRGCSGCSGRVGRISEASAIAVMREAGWIPKVPYPGPRAVWPSACELCGRLSGPRYETVKSAKSGCRPCAAARVSVARRHRFEPVAAARMREAGLEPLEKYPGAQKPWRCRCTRCDQITHPTYGNVSSGGRGCETCRRRAQGQSARSNKSQQAEQQIRSAGYEPIEPYPGAEHRWACLCRCGAETQVRLGNVVAGQRGCRACAQSGFNSRKPAMAYLLHHQALGALKVGVANAGSVRLTRFRQQGWEPLAVELFDLGLSALGVEDAMLGWWRKVLQLGPYLTEVETPTGGWTETVDADAVQPLDAVRYFAVQVAARRQPASRIEG